MKINQSDYVTPIPEDTPEEKHKGRKNKKKCEKAKQRAKARADEKVVPEEISGKTVPEEPVKEMASEQVTEEPVDEIIEESVEETVSEVSDEEVVGNTSEDVSEEDSEDVSESVSEEDSEEFAEDVSDESVEEEISEKSVEEVIEEEEVSEEPPEIEEIRHADETNDPKSSMTKKKKILIGVGSVAAIIVLALIIRFGIVPVYNNLPEEEEVSSDTKDYVRNFNPKAEDVIVDEPDRNGQAGDAVSAYEGPVRDVNGDGEIDAEDYRYYRPGKDTNAYKNKKKSNDKTDDSSSSDRNSKTNTAEATTEAPVKTNKKENILNFFAPDDYDGTGVISKGNSGKTPNSNTTTLSGTKATGFNGKIYVIGSNNEGKELAFEYDVKDLIKAPINMNTHITVTAPKSLSGDAEKAYWKDKSSDTLICQLTNKSSDGDYYNSDGKNGADYVKKQLGTPSCVYVNESTDEAFLVYNFGTYYAIAGFVKQSSNPMLSYVSFYPASYWDVNRNLFLGCIVYGEEF